ncbi:MAG: putative drug exporter of the superfamily, partial [Chloroflexota bacterium]|nr:putative drug exporter of the superfamily [Chloroflexota bacterium]
MFELLANVVTRRGWILLLGWLVFSVTLYWVAPPWERVSRDDDVRFFPPGSLSVLGQALLERGFPQDAASAQLVVVGERRRGLLTPADFDFLDQKLLPLLNRAREREPALGIKRIDTHRTPVIGPRLVGTSRDGAGQAALTIVSFHGTYLAKTTRLAVNRLQELLATLPPSPPGLRLALTGSAMVGHDINEASNRSIANTTNTTIALVVVILLVVYRSPVLALIPLVTIALSAFTSMKAIAVMTLLPRLHFQVINITNIFVIVVLFGAGTDYCLFLIARYREELIRGRTRPDALRAAIVQVGGALVASAGTVIVGLGMLWFSSFAKIQYTGPAIALSLAIALAAALTLAPVLLYWLRGAVFWPFPQPHHVAGHDPEQESLEQMPLSGFWVNVANLVVRHPVAIL